MVPEGEPTNVMAGEPQVDGLCTVVIVRRHLAMPLRDDRYHLRGSIPI